MNVNLIVQLAHPVSDGADLQPAMQNLIDAATARGYSLDSAFVQAIPEPVAVTARQKPAAPQA